MCPVLLGRSHVPAVNIIAGRLVPHPRPRRIVRRIMTHATQPPSRTRRSASVHRSVGSVRDLLTKAVQLQTSTHLARLRRSEVQLSELSPRPTVVMVCGVASRSGTSTLAALVAQAMSALAPDRVVALDGDG